MKRLPRSLDEIHGLRAARWIRESTQGQFDRYGPGAQRDLQDAAIRRFTLADTGLAWSAAQSGSTVHAGSEMRAMLAGARRGEFDLLLVGYVARWQRNLRQTLNLLEEDLHPAGVAVYFCDEELLSSAERHWDQLVDEAKAAESGCASTAGGCGKGSPTSSPRGTTRAAIPLMASAATSRS